MKRILPFIIITLLCISTTFAQQPKREKIKALKTAFITNELNLTSSEAEKFWPIYNASQEKTHALRKQSRQLHQQLKNDFEAISETDAVELLNKSIDLQNKIHDEKNALVNTLRQVLPAKKIIQLKKAENDFNKKLLKKFRDHKGPNGDRRHPPR